MLNALRDQMGADPALFDLRDEPPEGDYTIATTAGVVIARVERHDLTDTDENGGK